MKDLLSLKRTQVTFDRRQLLELRGGHCEEEEPATGGSDGDSGGPM